ncbi:ABC transporter substrate-binding protein [Microbacterium luticocti]|uniref:ABC transporter substrate-binding protein n=1 Tax=Microbacterium luticocti TaxID=451764 RepID=UPI00048C0644|nr:extracellular solute-binding protein [Microbacterium luticocti]
MPSKSLAGRAVALVGVGALAVGLSACGGTSENGDKGATGSGPVSITYLHRLPDGEGMTPVKDIVATWNAAHPDIQVTATKFDGKAADMDLKLEQDIKAGTGPCLAQIGYGDIPDMYVKGLVQDVTAEAQKYADHFSAGAFGMMKVGDKVVGLPQDTGPLVYFYDEAAFTKLGLTVPATMDDLAADAKKAAAAGKFVAAFTPDEAQNWLSGQAAAAGDTWFGAQDDKWKVTADGAGSQKVAALWQGLLDGKQVFVGERWGDAFTKALTDGSLIGHVGAAWEAGFLLDPLNDTPREGTWRVATLPRFGDTDMTGPDGGSGVAVMKGCTYPAQAMEFNDWFNTQVDDLTSQGLVVAAKGTPTTPEKMKKQFGGQDVLGVLAKANDTLNPDFPYMPGWASEAKMNEVAAAAASGKAKVADIFTTAQSTAVKTLQDLGLPVAD